MRKKTRKKTKLSFWGTLYQFDGAPDLNSREVCSGDFSDLAHQTSLVAHRTEVPKIFVEETLVA